MCFDGRGTRTSRQQETACIQCNDPASLNEFCHIMNFHDMSPNVTMLNDKFLVIRKCHETSPITTICHQMSSNVTMLNETKWHLVTVGDVWWYSGIFHDNTMYFVMTCHYIPSNNIMTCHSPFERGESELSLNSLSVVMDFLCKHNEI